MIKAGLFMVASMFATIAHANDMAKAQALGEEVGHAWSGSVSLEANTYAQELSEKHPFSAPDTKNIFEQGIIEFQHNELGQFINEQQSNNPAWKISDKDRLWERAEGNQSCEVSYTDASCIEMPQIIEGCVEQLVVETEQPPVESFYLEIYASSYADKKTTFNIDLKNGSLLSQKDANSAHGWSTPILGNYDCSALTFTHLGWSYYYDSTIGGDYQTEDVEVEAATTPSCTNHLTTSFTISQTHHKKNKWKNRGVKQLFRVTYKPSAIIHDRWSKTCMGKPSLPKGCDGLAQELCLEGPAQKVINGKEVMRDCWKRKSIYHCPANSTSCDTLRQKGCEQYQSSCKMKNEHKICSQFEIQFKCPQSSCETKKEAISAYCQDGNCFAPKMETLGGFEEAMSHLSGVVAAGHDAQFNEIFKGQAMSCRKMGIGFSNCCQDKGWGQDLHLTSCKEEEELLAMAKEAGRAISVGEYCDKKVIGGGCVEKKKSYCVYPSKIAKIIQQGAINQLGRSLGEAEEPQCTPLSPQDLQALDWNRIDFSELYSDIRDKTKTLKVDDFERKIYQALAKNN